MDKLKDEGYFPWKTEYYAFGKKHDLWGFGDFIALRGEEILLVQATSYSNVSSRVKKITEHVNVLAVRDAGIRIEVWGWRYKDNQPTCRIVDLS